MAHTLYISSMSCSNCGSSQTCFSILLCDRQCVQCAKVVWLLKIEIVNSAGQGHLKRFSYLPEQGRVSPLLDQQSSK